MKKILIVVLLFAGIAALYVKFGKQGPVKPGPVQPDELMAPAPVKPEVVPTAPPEVQPPVPELLQPVTSYKDALAASTKYNRPVFLYFGAEWCHYCKVMKANTLADAEVKEKLGKEYVVCFIDTDKDKATTRKYKVTGIPAYMVVTADETVIVRESGNKSKAEFLNWLRPKNVSLIDP